MPILLTIGTYDFVLAETANVNLIMKELARAKQVAWDYKNFPHQHPTIYRETKQGECDISSKVIKKEQILPLKPVLKIPEKASPDCHGDNIFKLDT